MSPCAHGETTAPDERGFVICLGCLLAIRRPQTMDELIAKLKS